MTPEERYPWLTPTAAEDVAGALARTSNELHLTRADASRAVAVLLQDGDLVLEGGARIALADLVDTPFGYIEVPNMREASLGERAVEALAILDRDIAIKELDAPRSYLALLSKRLEEEQAAQAKAGTTRFQTLDILTEKVIASWLREQADADDGEGPDLYSLADSIEAGEHRGE